MGIDWRGVEHQESKNDHDDVDNVTICDVLGIKLGIFNDLWFFDHEEVCNFRPVPHNPNRTIFSIFFLFGGEEDAFIGKLIRIYFSVHGLVTIRI